MTHAFKTIGIFGRLKNPGVKETLKTLLAYLKELGVQTFVEIETAESLSHSGIKTISREALGQYCDLLIVVGGDGSLLHATHAIADFEVPVIGINRGSLGFLTDIHPIQLEKIKQVLEGQYFIEKRFLLTTRVEFQGNILGEKTALNEVALIPDLVPHMIEFEIFIDEQFVCSQDSDGMIIATPTGSTAYALSGGGPILHPGLDAMVLVPMFPHSLNSRPIVIEGDKYVQITITPNNHTSPRLCCDGQAFLQIPPASAIYIKKKKEKLHLVHPLDYDYYEALRTKLHWGKKLHYSE